MARVASFTDAWIETVDTAALYERMESHLLQMRGLKPLIEGTGQPEAGVASFTDAWIETNINVGRIGIEPVASFTDAWIETNLHVSLWG